MLADNIGSLKPRFFVLMAAIAIVPAFVKLFCYPHNIGADDAYIHLRIATNLTRGLGWGINPHQPVNLSTAPAFTLLLAAAEEVTSHAIGLAQIASVVAVIAGLALIFLSVLSETASVSAAFLAEIAAAFSVNLWRWNGALMEASYAFAVVALTLWMFRRTAPTTALHYVLAGGVLGVGLLLRPEMGLLIVLCLFVELVRASGYARLTRPVLIAFGIAFPVVPWCLFASRYAGSIFPTTFAAKSTHLHLVNASVFIQLVQVAAESFLFPALLTAVVLLVVRPPLTSPGGMPILSYFIPLGWVVGLSAFYYLKTARLQSPGRYLLPLLPCEVVLFAFVWAAAEARLPDWGKRMAMAALALHICFALALNYWMVMPSLRQFDGEYAATMRAAADELIALTQDSANKRVLVNQDIGVLSCEADGRFEIFDGGGLASPSLRNLTTRDQTEIVKPGFLVQSLGEVPDGARSILSGRTHEAMAAALPPPRHRGGNTLLLHHHLQGRDPRRRDCRGRSCALIGVLQAKMQEGDDNINRTVDVPLTTMSDFKDTKYLDGIWMSYNGNYIEVEHALRNSLAAAHGRPSDRNAVYVANTISGMIPAIQAANLNPIEALRYE